jgi:hypothetical protein
VCNALDTLIIHQKIAGRLLPVLGQKLAESQVEIFADLISYKILKQSKYPYLQKAKNTDFGREFLSLKMAIKTVEDIDVKKDTSKFIVGKRREGKTVLAVNLIKHMKYLFDYNSIILFVPFIPFLSNFSFCSFSFNSC